MLHINVINLLRNRFDFLSEQLQGNVDMLMICETKINDSFPIGQFQIKVFSTPFQLDSYRYGGCIIVFIKEDISANLLCIEIISYVLNE